MKTDVAIIGAGPGGSATAMFLAQQGISSVIVERAAFPRYHIGESLTGECGQCLRALGLEEEMVRRRYPVKHGVKVFGPTGKSTFYVPVAGGMPDNSVKRCTTWQVRRSEFDKMLADGAARAGTEIVAGEALEPLTAADGAVRGVRIRCADGKEHHIESQVLVDASGQGTFLAGAGAIGPKDRGSYDNQVAIFSQVVGGIRDDCETRDDTLIFYRQRHHWAWWIPLDDEVVSVGTVVPASYFASKNESKRDFLVRELHELNPDLAARLPEIRLVEETRAISNYSYHIRHFTGQGFLCVGDAHRFIDPVFSFGVFFAVKEAQLASRAIADYFAGAGDEPNPFAAFERRADTGMDTIQTLIDAFWNHPELFATLVHTRLPDDFMALFAGRVYMDTPSRGLLAMRNINAGSA